MLIKGGPANSGIKKPLREKAAAWRCGNGHDNKGFATRCLTTGCREERPGG